MSFYVLPIYEDDDNNDSNVSVPNDMHLQLATVEVLCNNTSRLLARLVKKISLIFIQQESTEIKCWIALAFLLSLMNER